MALYMFFYGVPDSHLDFLSDNAPLFDAYLAGEVPELKQGFLARLRGKQPPELPDDWPRRALEPTSPEINHRQIHVFHYVLNGSRDFVSSVGCVFQTWIKPRYKTPTIVVDGENFAFNSADTKRLLEMLENLTPELIRQRMQVSGRAADVQGDAELVQDALGEIGNACRKAIAKGQGLLWAHR